MHGGIEKPPSDARMGKAGVSLFWRRKYLMLRANWNAIASNIDGLVESLRLFLIKGLNSYSSIEKSLSPSSVLQIQNQKTF